MTARMRGLNAQSARSLSTLKLANELNLFIKIER